MASSSEGPSFFRDHWRNLVDRPVTPRIVVAVVCYLLIVGVTANHLWRPGSSGLDIGEIARRDYVAPATESYIDPDATEEARSAAAARIPTVYVTESYINSAMVDDLTGYFEKIENEVDLLEEYERILAIQAAAESSELSENGTGTPDTGDADDEPDGIMTLDEAVTQAVRTLQRELDDYVQIRYFLIFQVSDEDIRTLLLMDPVLRNQVRDLIGTSIREHNENEIRDSEESIEGARDAVKLTILARAETEGTIQSYARLAYHVASYFIRPNVKIDSEETERLRQDARNNTEPEERQVREGQVFLRTGEVVEEKHLNIMAALGITSTSEEASPWITILLFALTLSIAFVLGWIYLGGKGVPQFQDTRYYLLFYSILTVVYLSCFFLAMRLSAISDGTHNEVFMTFASLPVVTGSVLFTHYYTRTLSAIISGFIAVIIALAAGEPAILLPALFTSLAACLIVRRDCPKPLMIRAIIFLPLIWLVSLFTMAYTANLDLSVIQSNWLYLFACVAPAPVAMVLANYVLDAAFNIPTSSRLQEFDNQDHPLLRKLQLEAPGTWHHSMMVGLIAEAACQAVGGNNHLVMVGCMYHDIGKTRRPDFFIENQHGGVNVHDKYSPWLSKIIIESHVKDGITLARNHGLPQELIDLIPQHHGTSLIAFFFRKALALSEDGYVNEFDYRYPGPKPQTLEAACINIADAAESATRSLDDATPHRIESLINKIYEDRLLDGQFEECGLALNQLETIKDTIIDRLISAYHARIEYPGEEELKRQLQLKRAEGEKGTKKEAPAELEE